jgi:hypothetical protein
MTTATQQKRALYFGCRGPREPGHYLQEGHATIYQPPADCPWSIALMDSGLLKNGRHPDAETGRVWWTCGGRAALWYSFVWWDNSGDSRPGSNSGFYVAGFAPETLTPETARENAKIAFEFAVSSYPWVIERQRHPLVLQI